MLNPVYKLTSSHLNQVPRRRFLWGLVKYSFIFGLIGAYILTDNSYRKDDLGFRPDKQIGRVLTKVPIRELKVHDFFTGKYYDRPLRERSGSLFKRTLEYLYPYQFYKPAEHDYAPFYDYTKDYITPSMENHYHFQHLHK
jgi:hypothetical protein